MNARMFTREVQDIPDKLIRVSGPHFVIERGNGIESGFEIGARH